MISVIIYLLFWGVWFFINLKKYGLNSSSLLIGLYLVSAICLMVLVLHHPGYDANKLYLSATLYHLIIYLLFITPLVKHGNRLNVANLFIPDYLFKRVSYSLVIIGILTIALSIPGIKNILSFDSFEGARQDAIWGEGNKTFYSYGLIGYIATIGMNTPMFAIFMAFYRLFKERKADIVFYLLIFTSLSGPFMNLTIAGRDGLVRWLMFLICNIAIYRKYVSFKTIPFFLKLISLVVIGFICISFVIITFSRFGEGEDALMSVVEYIGMSSYFFSEIYKHVGTDYLFGFQSIFPVFPGGMNSLEIAKLGLNFSTSAFHTFAGSFVLYVGTFWTFIMAIVFNFLYNNSIGPNNFKLSNYFSYFIFYQVVYVGVFYFVYALLAWQCSFLIVYLLSKPYRLHSHKISN